MGLEILEKIHDIPEGLSETSTFNKKDIIIAKAITDNKTTYIKLDHNEHRQIMIANNETRLEPVIPYKNIERFIGMIFGGSGTGKTLIASEFISQYNKITGGTSIYICSTSIDDDVNLSKLKDIVKQIDISDIYNDKMPKAELREMIKNLFANKFVVFDDNDLASDEKNIRSFRDLLCEVGRKFNTSILFISHKNADAHKTKIILNELTFYICFKKNLKKNRILTEYYGIDIDYLKNIKTKSWAMFNFKYNKVITPYEIKDFEVSSE
jgi:hypothetical protein